MATKVTSARPIISAAAVDAVRPGLRTEFWAASRPADPPRLRAGRPTTVASGRTRWLETIATPRNRSRVPAPIGTSTAFAEPPAKTPSAIAAIPSTIVAPAMYGRAGANLDVGRTA